MAINIDERFISREQTDGEQRSAELIYLAQCTDGENELEAKYAVLAYCPAVYDAMVPNACHVEAINATMYEKVVRKPAGHCGMSGPPELAVSAVLAVTAPTIAARRQRGSGQRPAPS
jgi:hypothetical protein